MRKHADTSAGLTIRLLGHPELRLRERVLPPLATQKAQSLLAFLILNRDRPHARESIAALFWGDRDDAHARHSLSSALWGIRRLLPQGDYVLADVDTIQFNPQSSFWLDVTAFQEHLLAANSGTSQEAFHHLGLAADLYRGELLEGWYDDWCIEERYRLEALYLNALNRLISLCQDRGETADALRYINSYLLHDPLQEHLQLAALRALVTLGNVAGARQQWRLCCQVWQRELHTPPPPSMIQEASDLLGESLTIPFVASGSDHPAPPHGVPLAQMPFVGRSQELKELLARWEDACQGKANLLLIDGEPGVGKTRLLEEFAAVVRRRGGRVAIGRCWEMEHGLAYEPIADILRGLDIERVAPALPLWVRTELTRFLPELGSVPSNRREEVFQQTLFFQAMAAALRHAAADRPAAILLDDLQWASESTVSFLHYVARRLAHSNTLIVVTFRAPHEPAHPLARARMQLVRDGLAQPFSLEPLSLQAVQDLVRLIGRVQSGPEFARQLYEHTDGNPLFLVETLRALEGAPARANPLPVSQMVSSLIETRLDDLSDPARVFISFAAAAGVAFDVDLVATACGMDEQAALGAVDELLHRRVIRESSTRAGQDLEFDHPLIRQVVYTGLHHRRRRYLHRLVGEAMERRGGSDPDLDSHLAYYFDQAQVADKALAYAEKAALHSWNVCAASEAARHFRTALAWLDRMKRDAFRQDHDAKRFDLLFGLEQALDVLACRSEQAQLLDQLAALAVTLDDRARARVHLRRFWLEYQAREPRARVEAGQALALGRRVKDRSLVIQALYALALAWAQRGQLRRGQAFAQAAVAQARELADPVLESWSLLQLGYIFKRLGELERAEDTLKQALSQARDAGNLLAVGRALIHLGDVHAKWGQPEQAKKEYHAALDLGRELGYLWTEADALERLNSSPG